MTSKTENADGVLFALADPIEARLAAAQRHEGSTHSCARQDGRFRKGLWDELKSA
jgi:hypothetical protein